MGLEAGLALQREPVLKWGGAVATPRPHRALPKVGGPQTHLGTHGEPVPKLGGLTAHPQILGKTGMFWGTGGWHRSPHSQCVL